MNHPRPLLPGDCHLSCPPTPFATTQSSRNHGLARVAERVAVPAASGRNLFPSLPHPPNKPGPAIHHKGEQNPPRKTLTTPGGGLGESSQEEAGAGLRKKEDGRGPSQARMRGPFLQMLISIFRQGREPLSW